MRLAPAAFAVLATVACARDASAQACGEATCQPVSSQPFYSYFVGSNCNGKEYGRLDVSTDGRAPSWDQGGLAGTTYATVPMLSYRTMASMGGVCTNIPVTMVGGAQRIYRCPQSNGVQCNGSCIVDDGLQCCPSTVDGTTCTLTCGGPHKRCTPSSPCIADTGCCGPTDCMAPPNGCYTSPGTCTAGACNYAFANGKACDADGNKCTPNDACMNGSCVADTAHTVVCKNLDCKSGSCNTVTGNCDYVNVGGACGGTGCYTAGTCSAGVCSGTPKDCSGGVPQCNVGICDADTGACGTNIAMNGTACTLADKCMTSPMCSGGTCIGTPKECKPSGPCVLAECDPASGACVEQALPVGQPCQVAGACAIGGACDDKGQCVGAPLPDGTPCTPINGCAITATCRAGQCACGDQPGGDMAIPSPPPTTTPDGGCGCALGGVAPTPWLALLSLCVLALAARRARR